MLVNAELTIVVLMIFVCLFQPLSQRKFAYLFSIDRTASGTVHCQCIVGVDGTIRGHMKVPPISLDSIAISSWSDTPQFFHIQYAAMVG